MKMKGKNEILLFVIVLEGLLEQWKWRKYICNTSVPTVTCGNTKWKTKNLFNVGELTQYPPQTHSIKHGKGDNKFVITVQLLLEIQKEIQMMLQKNEENVNSIHNRFL